MPNNERGSDERDLSIELGNDTTDYDFSEEEVENAENILPINRQYQGALAVGKRGNDAFHRQDFGNAIEDYKKSCVTLVRLKREISDAGAPRNPRIDIQLSACIFTVLLNRAASFLDFWSYDEEHGPLSRFKEAIKYAKYACDLVEDCQRRHGPNCRPSNKDRARWHRIVAAACQGLGLVNETYVHAEKVLLFTPNDQNCLEYVSAHRRNWEGANLDLLSHKLQCLSMLREKN